MLIEICAGAIKGLNPHALSHALMESNNINEAEKEEIFAEKEDEVKILKRINKLLEGKDFR